MVQVRTSSDEDEDPVELQVPRAACASSAREPSQAPSQPQAPKMPTAQGRAIAGTPDNVSCTEYSLAFPLDRGGKAHVQSYSVYTKLLTPRPAVVAQADTQRVVYQGNHHVLSPYPVTADSTTVRPPLLHNPLTHSLAATPVLQGAAASPSLWHQAGCISGMAGRRPTPARSLQQPALSGASRTAGDPSCRRCCTR